MSGVSFWQEKKMERVQRSRRKRLDFMIGYLRMFVEGVVVRCKFENLFCKKQGWDVFFWKLVSAHGLAFMTVHKKVFFGTDVYLYSGRKRGKSEKNRAKKMLSIRRFNPNRSLDPEQISLDCWADGLPWVRRRSGLRRERTKNKMPTREWKTTGSYLLSITNITITV